MLNDLTEQWISQNAKAMRDFYASLREGMDDAGIIVPAGAAEIFDFGPVFFWMRMNKLEGTKFHYDIGLGGMFEGPFTPIDDGMVGVVWLSLLGTGPEAIQTILGKKVTELQLSKEQLELLQDQVVATIAHYLPATMEMFRDGGLVTGSIGSREATVFDSRYFSGVPLINPEDEVSKKKELRRTLVKK